MSRLRKDKERAENDIRVRDERIDRISQDAYRDGLTEVGNKSAYNQAVEKLNGKIDSENTEFAVIMMDINDLKKINDEHGHECGDEYIKGCSKILCDAVPHSPVFRIGGDEFVAILEGADYERRKDKLDSIRRGFAEAIQQTDVSPWLRFSAAVGMAENTRDDKHFDAVFKRADEEMYRLKKKYKEQNGSYR
jgi:diguanylate cyclase (GGDEF)-like protein